MSGHRQRQRFKVTMHVSDQRHSLGRQLFTVTAKAVVLVPAGSADQLEPFDNTVDTLYVNLGACLYARVEREEDVPDEPETVTARVGPHEPRIPDAEFLERPTGPVVTTGHIRVAPGTRVPRP